MTGLRGFLGLTGYYRKFVSKYGLLAKPLTNILRLKQLQWSTEEQVAFDKLNASMTTTPVLALPNFKLQFTVETDACAEGIGAVPDKKDFGYSFPCDGPGRGGTCDISAWDAFCLAVFWMLNTIGWVTFYWH
jgi:hypothetical protein